MTSAACPSCSASLAPTSRACASCGWAPKPKPFVLSPDQEHALTVMDSGVPFLLTGPAGTGKTFVLNYWLKHRAPFLKRQKVAKTASTGIAATHIDGRTIHSWAGIGKGEGTAKTITEDPRWGWQFRCAPRIRQTDVLVLDEASMIDGRTFSLISDVCKIARGPGGGIYKKTQEQIERAKLPFGGIQLALVGDMGQLSPVEDETGYAFETEEWWDAGVQVLELTTVHRQEDQAFVDVLREIRDGRLSDGGRALLESRVRAYDPDADPPAVHIFTTNNQVDGVNGEKLRAIQAEEFLYLAVEEGDAKGLEQIDKNCLSPRELRLKVGARVMFTRNEPSASDGPGRYVNGTLGTVTWATKDGCEVTTDTGYVICPEQAIWEQGVDSGNLYVPDKWTRKPVLRRHAAKGEAVRLQIPLRLAWAITAHKSQGFSMDRVSVNLRHCFAPGQAYVALSRVRTLAGLNIADWAGAASIIAHPDAIRFMRGEYAPPPEYYASRGKPVPHA